MVSDSPACHAVGDRYPVGMSKAWSVSAPRRLRLVVLGVGLLALGGCASAPPRDSQNLCQVFDQYPGWYRDARAAQKRWGTPVNVLMAFVQRESGFKRKARPKRPHFLFIPLPAPVERLRLRAGEGSD